MKPHEKEISVVSTLQGEQIDMKIHEGALTHIMSVLTDLYNDPELAIIREIATNALDAHMQFGIKKPIEVTTPTPLKQSLTIRDYGEGLDEKDIREIYSQYGVSTKRTSNDVVGMLGLGCKSPLAYTNQFTVASIKNGRKITVSVSRDEKGAGVMNIISSVETDDPSGTEVVIPIKSINSVDDKTKSFFRYWDKGLALVNGRDLSAYDDMLKITDNLYIEDVNAGGYNYNDNKVRVVMGNVAYPGFDSIGDLPYSKRVVAKVPVGSVQFPPNRESLQDSKITRQTLSKITDDFKEATRNFIEKKVDAAQSKPEAIRIAEETLLAFGKTHWSLHQAIAQLTYKGEEIPYKWRAETNKDGSSRETILNSSNRSLNNKYASYSNTEISLPQMKNYCWVLNYTNKTINHRSLDKASAYFADTHGVNGLRPQFFSGDYVPLEDWLENTYSVEWETLKKWKDPNAIGSKPKEVPEYDMVLNIPKLQNNYNQHTVIQWSISLTDEVKKKAPYYIVGNRQDLEVDERKFIMNKLIEVFDKKDEDFYLVVVPISRVEKLKRLHPEIKEANAAMKEEAHNWWKGLTKTQKLAVGSKLRSFDSTYKHYDPKKFDDPTFKEVIKVLNTDVPKSQSAIVTDILRQSSQVEENVKEFGKKIEILGQNYPLLRYNSGDAKKSDHVYLYANTVYEKEVKEKK